MIRRLLLAAFCITAVHTHSQNDNQIPDSSKLDTELIGTGLLTPKELTALYALLKHITQQRS
jgi:hypothetical protein